MPHRILIDNRPARVLCQDTRGIAWDSFLDASNEAGLTLEERKCRLMNDWMLFLEFIGLGKVIAPLSLSFSPSLATRFSSLWENPIPPPIEELNLFVDEALKECLICCRGHDPLSPDNLIAAYENQKTYCKGKGVVLLEPIIAGTFATDLQIDPISAHSQLCLYLAWHLFCRRLASLIAWSPSPSETSRITELFQPVLAAYYHIVHDHYCQPNLFRLLEAGYVSSVSSAGPEPDPNAKDFLQTYLKRHHTESKEDLGDCSYADAGILGFVDKVNGEPLWMPVTVFTCDELETIHQRLSIARYMLEKLHSEVQGWRLIPQYACKVVCLKYNDERFTLSDVVQHAICAPAPRNLADLSKTG